MVRACHPEPTAAVTVVSVVLALAVGLRGGTVALIGTTVLASQLMIGWTNDALDAGRDAAVGRRDKPVPAGMVGARTVGTGAVLAGVAFLSLAFTVGVRPGLVILVAGLAGLAYDWPLKFTALSVLPYLVAFAGLATYVPMARPGAPVPAWWLPTAGALLGAGAHFANALPDLEDDARTGVRGLPHRLGRTVSTVASAVLLLAATGVLAFGPRPVSWASAGTFVAAALVLPAGWWAGRAPGSRAPFRAVLVVAVLDVILLVIAGTRL